MARTGNKCRHTSYDVDDERCRRFVVPVDPEERGAFLEAAAQWNRINKRPGDRTGPLLERGLEVLRHLWREAIKNGGHCCPSQAQIAAALQMTRRTVQRTLAALHAAGFVEWMRRTVVVDDAGRREQTSNLYRLNLPRQAADVARQLLGRRTGRRGPLRSARVVHDATLADRRQRLAGRNRLAGVLARLASLVGEGPSAKRAESPG